jgi:4-hydroxy-tetrahydrodipicolinate synthase
MKKPIFEGSGVAIITPFTNTGVDFAKLAELCEFHIRENTDAIVVAGTTGEASTMPDVDHLEAVRCVVETVAGRIPVIAGSGSNDTKHAVSLSLACQKIGADGLLCVTPYYNKTSQNGLYLHFKAIADAVHLPIIVYNVPSRTGMNINPETCQRIAALSNINGIKECRIEQAPEVANLCGDNLNMYSGEDAMVLPLMSLGGKGVISVMANIVPHLTHQMAKAFLDGNTAEATRIQIHLVPLIKVLFMDVNPIPVKAAMNMMGMQVGPCRMPLCDLSSEHEARLLAVLRQYKLVGETK